MTHRPTSHADLPSLLELAEMVGTCIPFLPPAGQKNIGRVVEQLALIAQAGPEWLPIDSAPRDGTRFFGSSYYVSDSTGNAAMWVAFFDQECGHFRSSWDLEPLYDMTNWKTPPPPPKESE